MTALAKCKDCAAITLDTDEDARKHREWHRDFDQKFRNTRTAAVEARDALAGLRSAVTDLRTELAEQPEPIAPDEITVNDMRDDDELGLHDPDELPDGTDPSSSDDEGDTDDGYDDEDAAAPLASDRDPIRDFFSPRA